jgi:C-terminal processing protease CtpA/Prc
MALASIHDLARCAVLALAAAVVGCGGGGDAAAGGGATPATGWTAGSFLPASSFAGRCVNPRSGTNPQTGQPYNETRGTATDENNFLRSWSNDLYLWYNEIVDRDPSQYTTPDYFKLLKTPATTASGRSKDQFHFTYSTAEWLSLSQSGVEAGYGPLWAVISSQPPRRIVVAYTEPGSPAASNPAFARGAEVLRIDNVDVVSSSTQADVDTFVAGLYPDTIGEQHTFVTRDRFGTQRTVTLTSAAVTKTPVLVSNVINWNGAKVGYVLFNDHIRTAEQQLITAFEQMRSAGVNDLVLDVRYNGGGYLYIASQVAYMIAGSARTSGRTFEKLQFNDKHMSVDPVTGQPLTPVPFLNTSSGSAPQALPTLNLPRVYVVTGGSTCSASESIINSLRGVGVQVIQIGSTTCGKPYGFYPQDNCGTSYFSIQFKGVNDAAFGDYADGFAPGNAPGAGGTRVAGQGCSVADDFTRELGDSSEARLRAALDQSLGGACPAPSGQKPSFTKPTNDVAGEDPDVVVRKSAFLTNRILERP